MTLLLKAALRLEGWRLSRRFDRAAAHPQRTQQHLLFHLLHRNAQTEFGRRHDFAGIRSEADYRKQVPVQEYDDLLPSIQKIRQGGRMLLTADRVRRFNITSGTTGEPKFIPVTDRSQHLAAQLMLQWFYRAWRNHPTLLDHGSLLISSPAIDGLTEGGIPFGSATGLIHSRLPPLLKRSFVLPRQVSDITDYDLRYYLIARLALARRVSFIATPNPSTLLRLAQVAAEHHETLIRSIHNGTLGGGDLPAAGGHVAVLKSMASTLAPDSPRADFLSRVVERQGRLRLGDCWPELALLACWLGGSVGYSAEKLREQFDDAVPIRDLGFQASEGSFTLPWRDRTAAGILALHNQYYEFLNEDALEQAHPPVIPIDQLERGRQYAILLTTPGGLYRYNINDIVEVDDWYRDTPVIRFIRKGRDMANITGEKIHLNHLLEAMNELRRVHAFLPPNFRAVPNIRESRYELYVELCAGLSPEFARHTLIPGIDRALSAMNIEYGEKRRSKRLGPPRVFLMREGWEQHDRRRFAESKGREAQYKWKILVTAPVPGDDEWISHRID
ncbi:MAG: GH3 auxin-responsive promoter family protein, partial [Nitrospirae bacterium]|nr:GH3 auxin-responsive promoter family protein [Nitrospirota bacterium]